MSMLCVLLFVGERIARNPCASCSACDVLPYSEEIEGWLWRGAECNVSYSALNWCCVMVNARETRTATYIFCSEKTTEEVDV